MSRGLTSGVVTEVESEQLSPILLLKAEFDGGDLRLWSGVGDIVYNSETYTGAGNLLGISNISETTDIEARGAVFALTGIDSSIISTALSENYQGRPISCWMGFLGNSPAIVADPVLLFKGRMDVLQIDESGAAATLSMQVENKLIDLKRSKVRRYTSEDQKQEYPSDLGLDFVPSLQDMELIWGK